jgi:uncharacterized membrane protein
MPGCPVVRVRRRSCPESTGISLARVDAGHLRLGRWRSALYRVDISNHGAGVDCQDPPQSPINDEGATALRVLTAGAALASLASVLAELGHSPSPYQISLGIATILLSWIFMHTMFALHYTHEFYGQGADDRMGGLVFPGNEDPDYWDFLYYSMVVAMTAQVSDVQITSKTIRRLTTLHGAISFFFNATVLALAVNIVSSLMRPDQG